MTKIYPAIGFCPTMYEGHEYTKVAFADFAANDNTDKNGYYTKILTIYEKENAGR